MCEKEKWRAWKTNFHTVSHFDGPLATSCKWHRLYLFPLQNLVPKMSWETHADTHIQMSKKKSVSDTNCTVVTHSTVSWRKFFSFLSTRVYVFTLWTLRLRLRLRFAIKVTDFINWPVKICLEREKQSSFFLQAQRLMVQLKMKPKATNSLTLVTWTIFLINNSLSPFCVSTCLKWAIILELITFTHTWQVHTHTHTYTPARQMKRKLIKST